MTLMTSQQITLVVLRTLIGWHFLYEGYTKLLQPAWGRAGAPLAAWSSAGYLKAATGPLAERVPCARHRRRGSARSTSSSRSLLVAVGLSLMLGLFTQAGCAGALALLAMFYLSAIPLGLPEARVRRHVPHRQQEPDRGWRRCWCCFAFRTGRIAGLDRWIADAPRDRQSRAGA